MNENEILEVEMELGGGNKIAMKIQESEDWSEIKKGTRAIMSLVNNQQMLVEINQACEDEGVSFEIIEGKGTCYHYEANVVASIFTEVSE